MEELKVLTLNTWGLLYISKDVEIRMAAIGDALSQSDYDIVGLQEVWCERHYDMICEKVKDVLPYSHRFVSGFLGSGCATFSKYPIIDTVFHKYLFNGYFWDITHGDWFGGKGLAGCVIIHPKKNIYFFNTHMHADYEFDGGKNFHECRTLQMYQIAQSLKHLTRPHDAIIISGDFNHETHELGVVALKQLMNIKDSYEIAEDKPDVCNTIDNVFNKDYNDHNEPIKRIDFIFVNDYFECIKCNLAMQMIPGTNMHYSDHEGYEVKLRFTHEKESVCHQIMDSHQSEEILTEIQDVVVKGQNIHGEIQWTKAISLITLFSLFILVPIFLNGLFYLPGPETWPGKFVFILQVTLSMICIVYLWMSIVVRKQDMNSFKNVAAEIQVKLEHLKLINGKKQN